MYIHGEVITNKYCIIYGFLVLLNPRNNATFDNLVKSRSDLLESLEKIQCLSRHRTETVTQSLFCTLAEFFYVSSLTRVENVLSRLLLLPRCILCILARETNRSRLVARCKRCARGAECVWSKVAWILRSRNFTRSICARSRFCLGSRTIK